MAENFTQERKETLCWKCSPKQGNSSSSASGVAFRFGNTGGKGDGSRGKGPRDCDGFLPAVHDGLPRGDCDEIHIVNRKLILPWDCDGSLFGYWTGILAFDLK